MVPADRRYSKQHQWVKLVGPNEALIGMTGAIQRQPGVLVFVELPSTGSRTQQFRTMGKMEWDPASCSIEDRLDARQAFAQVALGETENYETEVPCPLTGEVIAVNELLAERPDVVVSDPYGDGWLVKVRFPSQAELDALLPAGSYPEAENA